MSDDWHQDLMTPDPRGGGPDDGEELFPPPPWEDRPHYGRLAGFLETVPRLLFRPTLFFRGQPVERGPRDPLLFAAAVGLLSGLFLSLWLHLAPALQREFLKMLTAGGHDPEAAAAALRAVASGPLLVIAPLAALLNVLLTAALSHLVLLLAARPRGGYGATLRVVAYAYGVNVWTVVPSCGGLIALAWSIPVSIVGLTEVQRVDPWRAALAVALPPLVCATLTVGMVGTAARLAG